MPGARVEIALTDDERETLERWARRPTTAQALAMRCRIVLAARSGEQSKDIADEAGLHRVDGREVAGPVRASVASTGCTTSRGRASRARSAMTMSSG